MICACSCELLVHLECSRQHCQTNHVSRLQRFFCKLLQPLHFLLLFPQRQLFPNIACWESTTRKNETGTPLGLKELRWHFCNRSEQHALTMMLLEHFSEKQLLHHIILHFHQEEDIGQSDTTPRLSSGTCVLGLPGRGEHAFHTLWCQSVKEKIDTTVVIYFL